MNSLPETRCTRERPWSTEAGATGSVNHVDAHLTYSDYHGSHFECPHCGLRYELVKDEEPRQSCQSDNHQEHDAAISMLKRSFAVDAHIR